MSKAARVCHFNREKPNVQAPIPAYTSKTLGGKEYWILGEAGSTQTSLLSCHVYEMRDLERK
eukprot:294009-Karenia_brevis.AAC.1